MRRLRHPLQIAATVAVLAWGVGACGGSSSTTTRAHSSPAPAATTPAPPRSSATIRIQNYAYHPGNVTLLRGAKVTFVNEDAVHHTATSRAGPAKFDTGPLNQGKSMTLTLSHSGSYTYICRFHTFMVAHLTVVNK